MGMWKFKGELQDNSNVVVWRWIWLADDGKQMIQSDRAFKTPAACVNDAKRWGYRDRYAISGPPVAPHRAH